MFRLGKMGLSEGRKIRAKPRACYDPRNAVLPRFELVRCRAYPGVGMRRLEGFSDRNFPTAF